MPTTNPVPSTDPTDLLFNAGKLDEVVNGTANSFTDRLGVARRTVAGMNADFDAQLADAESDLNVYRADAAASAAEALGYLQTIRATSYGAYAEDPATDPLGNPPTVGDEYFNTTANLLKRWNGTTWQASDINTANLAASSGSSLIGYMPAGTGAVAATVQAKLRETVSVKDFKCADGIPVQGDGIHDDTTGIQAALDHVCTNGLSLKLPPGTYVVTNNLYIYGKPTIKGEGNTVSKILLTAVPTRSHWIICGAASYGGTSNPFAGLIENLGFEVYSGLSGTILHGISMLSVDGGAIDSVRFITNGKVTSKAVGRYNNSAFVPLPTAKNFSVTNSVVVETPGATSNEWIGVGSCDGVSIVGNRCDGGANDDLGIHECTDVLVAFNKIESYDGRIYVADSKRVQVVDNWITYVGTSVTGMGIVVQLENTTNKFGNPMEVPKDIRISGNTVRYTSSVSGAGANYGIRVNGCRRVEVSGNRLINESTSDVAKLEIGRQTGITGWTDPDGLDATTTAYPREVRVIDNVCDGTIQIPYGYGIHAVRNTAKIYSIGSPAELDEFINNRQSGTFTDSGINNFSSGIPKLFDAARNAIGASFLALRSHGSIGSSSFLMTKNTVLTHMVVGSTTAISSGYYAIRIKVDGVTVGDTLTFLGPNESILGITLSSTDKRYYVPSGSRVSVECYTDPVGAPTPNDVSIKMFGITFDT